MHHLAYITVSIHMKQRIAIRYLITVVIRTLPYQYACVCVCGCVCVRACACVCVRKYFFCQYAYNVNPSTFSTVISCTIRYVPVFVYSAKC